MILIPHFCISSVCYAEYNRYSLKDKKSPFE